MRPPAIEEFVQQELASGEYRSEADLINQALSVYRELKLAIRLLDAAMHGSRLTGDSLSLASVPA